MKNSLFGAFLLALTCMACQNNTPTPASAENAQPATTNATICYEQRFVNDLTAIQLTIDGDNVTGFYAWEPHEKDSGRGKITGKMVGDEISGEFTYMIEGSIQTEEVRFKKMDGKLLQGRGELDDSTGKLMFKDASKLTFDEVFTATDCANIKDAIDRAAEVVKLIEQSKNGQQH